MIDDVIESDPDMITHEDLDDILERELGKSYSSQHTDSDHNTRDVHAGEGRTHDWTQPNGLSQPNGLHLSSSQMQDVEHSYYRQANGHSTQTDPHRHTDSSRLLFMMELIDVLDVNSNKCSATDEILKYTV